MVNTLSSANNDLPLLDYREILVAILQAIRSEPKLFAISPNAQRLLVHIEKIAHNIAHQNLPAPMQSTQGIRTATINFSPSCQQHFPDQIREIQQALREKLDLVINKPGDISSFISSLTENLANFKADQPGLNLGYPFEEQLGLEKQRLNIQKQGENGGLLKFHKLTITVLHTQEFTDNLVQELRRYIDQDLDPESEEDKHELSRLLAEMIEENDSDFCQWKKILDTEALGQLKKEAKICYLEYLERHIDRGNPDVIYLNDLTRRLRKIQEYINCHDKPDSDYEMNYAGFSVNLRQVFSRSEVLDSLPIIPIIDGYLGETTDHQKGLRQFVFGLKLKLNGSVQSQSGQNVFDYHLSLLDPEEEIHKNLKRSRWGVEKIFKIACLYFFIFASRCNPLSAEYDPSCELSYDPMASFEDNVLGVFQGDQEAEKEKMFRNIKKGFNKFNTQEKIKRLVKVLKNFLNQKTLLPGGEYSIHLGILKGILEKDVREILDRQAFFKDVIRSDMKNCLQYLLVDKARVNSDCLSQLPVKIQIRDMRYQEGSDRQSFSLSYHLDKTQVLPIALLPKKSLEHQAYKNNLQQRKLIVFYSDTEKNKELDHHQFFFYQFTFCLLFYMTIKCLLDTIPDADQLFVPIVRFHLTNKNNSDRLEEFMLNLSVVVSHLLNQEKYQSNFQGFDITSSNSFKTKNALSSLYSRLPKIFSLDHVPTLDKMALIVVSSRETDARFKSNSSERMTNLMGEVVSIKRQEDNKILIECLKTFSDCYCVQEMYNHPIILQDTITLLYEQGYRHFLYIAKAPYTSTLNITRESDEDNRLFFMSRPLIKYLKKNHPDIKIYPIFFDKYYVRSLGSLKYKSLYIQDIAELSELVNDPSQQSVVFFNLFNGIKVGNDEDRFYNAVISYATLLNTYQGILENQDISQGLLWEGTLKNDILQYLTLFHFSRYEATSKISLKLDPYQNIIGDYSVGNLSLFPHINGKIQFNSLAFLTQVKKALNIGEN